MNGRLWGKFTGLQYHTRPREGGLRAGPGDQGRTGHGPPGVPRAPRGAAWAITWLGYSSCTESLEVGELQGGRGVVAGLGHHLAGLE